MTTIKGILVSNVLPPCLELAGGRGGVLLPDELPAFGGGFLRDELPAFGGGFLRDELEVLPVVVLVRFALLSPALPLRLRHS